ncbi:MAG: FAD-binding protein [Hyphomicrobiales bacterium]|nr:FAD-binding protein [Hyphomicrobiales bacterium]
MGETFRPEDETGVVDVVAWAVAEKRPLELVGHGTKRAVGRPLQVDHVLDLSGLSGITLYEPEELVLSAGAGTALAEIEAALEANSQQLAFEPADYGPLLGGEADGASIGGVVAANLSGSRRLTAGAVRDHLLGIKGVSGRGEAFKSGGRVMKNVTGYDLSRGLAGSWGTLAALTEVTLKVLPRPETETSVGLIGLDDTIAIKAISAALGSSFEVSAAAHLPADIVPDTTLAKAGLAVTLFRIEGFGPSVDYRAKKLRELLGAHGRVEIFDRELSRTAWRDIRNVAPFCRNLETAVWRISTSPKRAGGFVGALRADRDFRAFYDWGGGLVWLETSTEVDAGEAAIRRALEPVGGHATLIRAPASVRAAVPVFQPQPPALAALTERYRHQFDPHRILNPGRMHAGGAS